MKRTGRLSSLAVLERLACSQNSGPTGTHELEVRPSGGGGNSGLQKLIESAVVDVRRQITLIKIGHESAVKAKLFVVVDKAVVSVEGHALRGKGGTI